MSDIEDMLSVTEPKVDTERALARLRARVEGERIAPVMRGGAAPHRIGVNIWVRGLAAAATVALVATLLTVSGVAETILTIFEPKQLVAVPITVTDLNGAASFGAYGTLTWTEQPKPYDVPDIRTAARDSGMTVLVPGNLPTGVGTARYGVMNKTTATFTFSADKTQKAAAAQQRTPPPMPANIDGSKLFITGGPAVVAYYDDGTSPAGATGASGASPFAGMPKLIVAQGKPPVVQSDGVTVEQLQSYLLAQPGISPQLAAQIRAIKDPSSTLPVPIPVDMATSKKVTVQGVEGIFVGDSTGLGSAVIWQKDGIVYGVAGTLTEQQVLAVANSLH
ncbi:MAG: hypothetical protein E6I19_04765 [Chloroflexi bacterium]|nr:MAG: hypothetical protein E6I48_07665 [Chloroflexota bacterium]TMF56842.1 MAG: hypothetical protein E6I19_04765 [Chloroflexota bacterium]